MLRRLRHSAPAVLSLTTVLLQVSPSFADWEMDVNYGANTKMDLYTPTTPAASPPIVVALHYCQGSAMSAHDWFKTYANQYGFLIITPQAGGECFDAAATRMGERANIAAMVAYTVAQKGADATRVYAAGASSGACMTQALLAAYPDVFAAGSSLAGVPAGAWNGGNSYGWSTSGVSGGAAWGDKVRNADPGFSGKRPRVQLWQGQGDTTLTYNLAFPPQVDQWTNVFGVTDADATSESVKPMGAMDTWARKSYKDDSGEVVLETNIGPTSVPHDLTPRGLWGDVVRFFGLDKPVTPGSGGMGGMAGTGSGGRAAGGTGAGGASGGVPGTGGTGVSGSGAASAAGGTGGTGGTGLPSNGGAPAASGGSGATAGAAPSTGGTSATAGRGAGGTGATGGSAPSGSGGAPGAGRSGTATGGVSSAGKASGAPPADDTETESGCGIASTGTSPGGSALALLGLGALGVALRRRRR